MAGRQISPTETFDSISVITTSKFNNKKLGNLQKQWKDTKVRFVQQSPETGRREPF